MTLKEAKGPNWLGSNTDPDYAYLFNSLSIIQGYPVAHIDHPGTPVQTSGALVIKFLTFINHRPDSVSATILDPEAHLNAIENLFLILNFSALLLLGIVTYRLTASLLSSLLLQLTPFISKTLLSDPLTKVSPEPLLLLSLLILLTSLLLMIYSPKNQKVNVLISSLAIGLGTATKLIFFPLIIVSFLTLNSFKQKVALVIGSSFFFYFFTKPIVENYPRLLSWVQDLFVHSGRNAEGSKTIIDLATFIPNLINQLITEPLLFLALLIEIILLLYLSWQKSKKNPKQSLLTGLILTQSFQILLVAKHPGASYLIPPLGTIIFSLIILLDILKESKTKIIQFLSKPLLISLILVFSAIGYYNISQLKASLSLTKEEQLKVFKMVTTNHQNQIIIRYHRSSSPLYALKFGNTFINNNLTHYLNNIYPDTYFWDIWNARFNSWNMDPISYQDLATKFLSENQKVIILQGTSFEHQYIEYPNYKPKLPLVDIYQGAENTQEKETIYQLDLTSPTSQTK